MSKAVKRLKNAQLRATIAKDDRCPARHPNLYWVKCEVPRHMHHTIHYGEERSYVWTDD